MFNMYKVAISLIASLLCVGHLQANSSTEQNKKKPNFLFIFADDQRYSTINDWGYPEVSTPNLDKLSQQGVSFTNTHIMGAMNAAVCAPSRAMVMTGRNVFNIIPSGEDIKPAHTTLPEHLKSAGYTTFHTGKWHNGRAAFARSFSAGEHIFFGGMSDHFAVPLNHFDPSGQYDRSNIYHINKHSTEIYADAAIEFLQQQKSQQQAFFMQIAFQAPHDPKQVPKSYIDKTAYKKLKPIDNFLPQHPFDNGELDVRDEWLTEIPRKQNEVTKHLAAYYAMVSQIDKQVGRILNTLEQTGLAKNTYVIYSSDNGIAMGQHGLMGKQNLYEHSLRVPLIIAGPDVPQQIKTKAFAYLFDIYPTIAELAGLQTPDTVDGVSLVPVLKGKNSQARENAVFAYKTYQRAIKQGDYKLIVYQVDGKHHSQLFNLKTDPNEQYNLVNKPEFKNKVKVLKQALQQALTAQGDQVNLQKIDWGVHKIPSWSEMMLSQHPKGYQNLKAMAEQENDMVQSYFD